MKKLITLCIGIMICFASCKKEEIRKDTPFDPSSLTKEDIKIQLGIFIAPSDIKNASVVFDYKWRFANNFTLKVSDTFTIEINKSKLILDKIYTYDNRTTEYYHYDVETKLNDTADNFRLNITRSGLTNYLPVIKNSFYMKSELGDNDKRRIVAGWRGDTGEFYSEEQHIYRRIVN